MRTVFALLPLAGLAFGLALPQRGSHGSISGGKTAPSTTTSSGGDRTTRNSGLGGNDFSSFTGGNKRLGGSDPTNLLSTGGQGRGSRSGGDPTDSFPGFGGSSLTGGDPTNVTNDPTDVTNGGRRGGRDQSSDGGRSGHGSGSNDDSPRHGGHHNDDNNSHSDPDCPEDPDSSDDDSHHGHHDDPDCDDPPTSYPKCGGLPSPNAPTCDRRSVCIEDPSHPCGLSFACYGICVPKKAPKCGGFAGLRCPKGLQCVPDTPLHGTPPGGADRFGICI